MERYEKTHETLIKLITELDKLDPDSQFTRFVHDHLDDFETGDTQEEYTSQLPDESGIVRYYDFELIPVIGQFLISLGMEIPEDE